MEIPSIEQNMTRQIDIALPCYNAEPWIDSFIGALLEITECSWRLVARDDGSADGTLELLRRWATRLGSRMVLIDEATPSNLGLIGNYNIVLAATTAPYVLTADPDDVWLRGHVSLVLDALREAEVRYGGDTPIAVGTDAIVVDENLTHFAESFWLWSRNVPRQNPRMAGIAMESAALGSTMALNRALLNIALPIPDEAAYQDWWVAMIAVGFGKLVLLPEKTILYRRHGANATKDPYGASLPKALVRLATSPVNAKRRLNFLIDQASRQAGAYLKKYRAQMIDEDAEALRALVSLSDLSPIARRRAIFYHQLWFGSRIKNIGLILLL